MIVYRNSLGDRVYIKSLINLSLSDQSHQNLIFGELNSRYLYLHLTTGRCGTTQKPSGECIQSIIVKVDWNFLFQETSAKFRAK